MTALPIIPWMGGKRRLIPFIVPLLPEHECYVEVFSGAAAIYFGKQPAAASVLNDINGELINLYRVVKHHYEEFIRQFKWAFTSRKLFEWHQMTNPETLTDIQRAARFYYLQKLCFGGRVEGQTFGTSTTSCPRLGLLTLEEDLFAAWERLTAATIECLPWAACVEKYDRPHTLFYCDPPYWQTEGYGVEFGMGEYVRMAALARTIAGTMIISVNDHPEMRRIFAGLPMRSVGITYTVGGGDQPAERKELVIGNWRDGWPAARPLTQQIAIGEW